MAVHNKSVIKCFLICVVCFYINSCTVLQWRSSDIEIKEKFDTQDIEVDISYHTVDSLDLKIRIQAVTDSNKPIHLIFFHGSPSSLSAWDGYVLDSNLRKKANIYAIDRPGYGYSGFGKEMTSITLQAELMSDWIKKNKLKNVITVGSSYGGPLAARIGYLNEEVKAVMMISPAIDPFNEKDIWASRFTRWKLTRWLVPTGYRVAGDEKKVHAQELEMIMNDWKKMEIPVYHIHGDVDDIVPYENIYFSQEHFQKLRTITLPDRGHEIAWKNPDLIIPYLLQMIEDIQAGD